MTDTNSVILIGRLTKDCGADERSFSFVGNGTAKAVVSLAVNRSVKKGKKWEDEVSFIDVTIWGRMAENLKPNLVKGKQICVKGFISQDRWVDNNNNKKSRVSITAESVQLLGDSNRQNNENNYQNDNGGYNQNYDDYNNGYNGNDFPEDIPYGN